MPATQEQIQLAFALRAAAEKEPPSSGRAQRLAAMNQYLSACNRDARDRGRRIAPTTAPSIKC